MRRILWLHFLTATALLLTTMPALSAPCAGGVDNEEILHLNLAKFSIEWKEKKPVCIHLSAKNTVRTFEVRILGPYKEENAPIEIHEKVSGPDKPTIRGSSSADSRTFTVTVTEASEPSDNSEDHEFWVKVPKVGKLDPMVRIIRQGGTTRQLQYNDLLEALDELDIDPEAVPELLMEFEGQTQTAE